MTTPATSHKLTSAQRLLAQSMSEEKLLTTVVDAAQKFGWKVAHFRPALTKKGWRTPVQADGKGYPDLVMLKVGRGIVAELKAERVKDKDIPAEQMDWLNAYASTGFAAFVWRPSDWFSGWIETVLR